MSQLDRTMSYKQIKIASLSLFLISFSMVVYNYTTVNSVLADKDLMHGIMNYPMFDILDRCQKDYNYTDDDMIILEKELKRYLILCALKENENSTINMYSTDVDNLWHSFILFTKEYAHFCNTYAQHFIHHSPKVDDSFTTEQLIEARKDFHSFIGMYEKAFGEEIHPIWLLDRFS